MLEKQTTEESGKWKERGAWKEEKGLQTESEQGLEMESEQGSWKPPGPKWILSQMGKQGS